MKSGAVTVLNESNFNFNFNNNNINKNNNSHQTKNKKSVRFAADESLQINKTGFTNTFKIGEYCKKCGSLRVGPFVEQGCKNCQIPKPSKRSSILTLSNNTKNNEYVDSFDLLNNRRINTNKNEFLTRSFDNVDQNYKTYQNSPSQIYYQPKSPYQNNNIYSNPSQIYYKQQERQIRPHTHYYSPRGTLTTEVEIENEIPEILERLSAGESLEEASINARQPIMPVKPRTSLIRPIYKCHACNGILQPGETAIMAEKVDRNLRWHPGCFACTICNELLVDLLYFNIGSDVYCEKHFDEIISWRKCAACDLPIKSNEYVCAENNYWHIEHFVCWNCDCSLAGQKYTVIDSMPYCFTCHERIYAKPCQTCKKKILPDQVRLTYEKLNWHSDPNCFKCHVCNLGLLESHFLLKNNLLFCSLDCKKKAVKN